MISCLSIFLPVAAIGISTSTPAAAIADDQSLRASSKSNSSTGSSSSSSDSDILQIKEAIKALSSLIDNWTKATTECIYADVPRELLESKNKDQLLEKASEFALFDKSTSVVSCKRTNRIVRDYIGATGKGPLVGIEKRLLRNTVVDRVDDSLDEYFSAVESFSQSLSRATSLSYTAGMADFDSVNNFAKDESDIGGGRSGSGESNLEQARRAIVDANDSLKKALSLISVVVDDEII